MASSSQANPGTSKPHIEPERENFRSLILGNPNYFGNLEKSPFKPVKLIKSDTSYEQLVCLGLNTPYDLLEAVLQVKKDFGYGGGICTKGTREYVRFYVDLHDNGIWHDVGIANVVVHDIPGDKPICYAVKLNFEPFRKCCWALNIVKVRAILSWNSPPPPNTPGFIPIYGNVLNVEVQIRPSRCRIIDLVNLFNINKIPLPDPVGPLIKSLNSDAPLPITAPAPMTFAQKRDLYANAKIPLHRIAFTEAQSALAAAESPDLFGGGDVNVLSKFGLTPQELVDLFDKLKLVTDGDTSFEELRCVGLYPHDDTLEAVLTVKLPSGYSGALCTPGSREFVAFWIDFADGAGFTYIGTTSIRVHDLKPIPQAGVQYAVALKADLAKRLIDCQKGAKVVRVRAILSWEVAPPPGNPNYVPVWGNREECLIQLRPGTFVPSTHTPVIETVSGVAVNDIAGTGLTIGWDRPFGGDIVITGRLGDPPDSFNGPAPRLKYKLEVSHNFGPWTALTNSITVRVSQALFGIPQDCDPDPDFDVVCEVPLTPTDDADGLGPGWYDYLEDFKGNSTQSLVDSKLGVWRTQPGMDGPWRMRITAKDPATSTVYGGFAVVNIFVDNAGPSAGLQITGATFNGNPIAAVGCGKFPVGSIISGTYEVHDTPPVTDPLGAPHFGSLSLDVIPDAAAAGATPALGAPFTVSGTTATRSYPVVPTTGEAGTWTLDTSGMQPCGYVLRLHACDRTIYNNNTSSLCATEDVGFCLEAP